MSQSKSRIAIDARMVGPVSHGISRYVTQIAKGLKTLQESRGLSYDVTFFIRPGLDRDFRRRAFFDFESLEVEAPFLTRGEILEIPRLLRKYKFNLYHSPSFSSLLICPCPYLVTVHDLNHLTFGGWRQKLYYQLLLRQFLHRAKGILTVSEFSRAEVADWLGISRNRVQVIYNSLSASLLPGELPRGLPAYAGTAFDGLRANLREKLKPGRYFFCLSNPKVHKNVSLLVQAYSEYRNRIERSGSQEPWPLVLSMSEFDSTPGIVSAADLSDIEIHALFSETGGAFFPSLYEGFGLPPVEAAVAGIRLAVSRIPPHLESLVDLGSNEILWVDPLNLGDWIKAFHRIQEQEIPAPSEFNRLKIQSRFSTAKMTSSINQAYCDALGINLEKRIPQLGRPAKRTRDYSSVSAPNP